jgi:hypothetical protein
MLYVLKQLTLTYISLPHFTSCPHIRAFCCVPFDLPPSKVIRKYRKHNISIHTFNQSSYPLILKDTMQVGIYPCVWTNRVIIVVVPAPHFLYDYRISYSQRSPSDLLPRCKSMKLKKTCGSPPLLPLEMIESPCAKWIKIHGISWANT